MVKTAAVAQHSHRAEAGLRPDAADTDIVTPIAGEISETESVKRRQTGHLDRECSRRQQCTLQQCQGVRRWRKTCLSCTILTPTNLFVFSILKILIN